MPEENKGQQNTRRTQCRVSVPNKLQLIHQIAKADKKIRFTNLMHHIYNIDMLRTAFLDLKKDVAPGVDRVTWRDYSENLEENLQDLSSRLRKGAYRAKPVKRAYIPKADGKLRPLGIAAMEDKIVQRAAVAVMSAIYEASFMGFSYGFRKGRGQHQALDALHEGIAGKKVNYVLDADIRDFFNKIDRSWLMKFIKHRIADKRVLRLIQKWLNAGILEGGRVIYNKQGTAKGSSVSPLLANVFLHYIYDLWIQQWRKQKAYGEVIVVRYADDTIAGFQHESDARRFRKELEDRLHKFGLEIHPEKTRLIEFGRFAAENREKRNQGKAETFTFLGFTHICGKTRKNGKFAILRHTIKKRMRAKLKEVKIELRKRMHEPIREVGKWLRAVVIGHYRYYGVPGNSLAMSDFRNESGIALQSADGYLDWWIHTKLRFCNTLRIKNLLKSPRVKSGTWVKRAIG